MKTRNPRIAPWAWMLGLLLLFILGVGAWVSFFNRTTNYAQAELTPVVARSGQSNILPVSTNVIVEVAPPEAISTVEDVQQPVDLAAATYSADPEATNVALTEVAARATALALATPTTPTCPPAWKIVEAPESDALEDANLYSVAAVSSDDVWAVGDYSVDGARKTLTEHWDGTRWNVVQSLNMSQVGENVLGGVVAASANDVWALGSWHVPNSDSY